MSAVDKGHYGPASGLFHRDGEADCLAAFMPSPPCAVSLPPTGLWSPWGTSKARVKRSEWKMLRLPGLYSFDPQMLKPQLRGLKQEGD